MFYQHNSIIRGMWHSCWSVALCKCRCLPCGLKARLTQVFRKIASFFPLCSPSASLDGFPALKQHTGRFIVSRSPVGVRGGGVSPIPCPPPPGAHHYWIKVSCLLWRPPSLVNKKRCPNVVLMLGQRRRRGTSITNTLGECKSSTHAPFCIWAYIYRHTTGAWLCSNMLLFL